MTPGLLYKIYSCITSIVAPVAFTAALFSKRGRIRPLERLGFWRDEEKPFDWWFHGASLGEVTGVLPIIKALKNENPLCRILLSATSPTGLVVGEGIVDAVRILPFDAPWCIRQALASFKVSQLVITETELWPCLLSETQTSGIRTHLVNGRISDYTVEWYERGRKLFQPIIENCCTVSVVAERDRERFLRLGAGADKTIVTGNTKYDVSPTLQTHDEVVELKQRLFPDSSDRTKLVVLGSIRPGEEGLWFEAFAAKWSKGDDIRVVVAPRHAAKYGYFAEAISKLGVPYGNWSTLDRTAVGRRIVLVDTMGILRSLYGVADLAFIGATLVNVGGHNPLEAAMYGCPVCVGPYTSVVQDICDDLRLHNALLPVSDGKSITVVLDAMLGSETDLKQVGEAGKEVWKRYTGATGKVLALIRR